MMAVVKGAQKPLLTTAVRSKIPEPGNHFKMLRPVVTLRPKHGNSATKYDPSSVKPSKILRRQFGRSYDQKKVRNTDTFKEVNSTSFPYWISI
jgi:hypothetical protein